MNDPAVPPVLLTGATGFVGSATVPHLLERGLPLRVLSRRAVDLPGVDLRVVPEFDDRALAQAMDGIEVVCHLAGRAHVTAPRRQQQDQFDTVNVDGSRRLARTAFRGGVRRMVFVSSIGAVGSASPPGHPLGENDPCRPTSAYGRSKRKAEVCLRQEADRHGGELVIIRPPLVHGPGAPGNLALLGRLVTTGVPLPLGGIENLRSLIHVRNLARVLVAALTVPDAAGRTFHVRDAVDYSTPQIIAAAGRSTGRRVRLFRAPLPAIRAAAAITGRAAAFEQLTGWLQVDDRSARRVLGVRPDDLPLEIGTAS
ncbi:NAD-dependent epimerase/dehydratase family protein [Nakamurella sp.]|uniref:NAD-dependent epimerase/dehydratase family protein n=1 Tax=Nakamurella sp. TaxID=1869182 RepID=UPI003B3A2325